MEFLEKLKEEAEHLAKSKELLLYDVEWLNENNTHILRVSLSKADYSIDLDSCSLFSEEFSAILDKLDLVNVPYYLEVCSPGAERVLRSQEEISGAVGQYVYVKLKDPQAGLHEVTGELSAADERLLRVTYKDKTRTKTIDILPQNIALIRLAIKF